MRARTIAAGLLAVLLGVGGILGAPAARADSGPPMWIDDVTQLEGTSGTTNYAFTVKLGYKSANEVDVNYATSDNSAVAPGDYTAVHGTLVFAAGSTSRTITVPVNGDTIHEANESFYVNLGGVVNASITDGSGLGVITDDDPLPYLSVTDSTVTEGDSGTVNATFSVNLSNASAQTVKVRYATSNNSAVTPSDYTFTQGTLTFAPGQTTKNVNVSVKGDTTPENDESFYFNLSNAVNAAIAYGSGFGVILNDDQTPTLTINNPVVNEGASGGTTMAFTVTLQPASTGTVSVYYATSDGSATLANNDYQYTQGTLIFTPGQTSKTVNVTVNGDTTAESNETMSLNLSSAVGGTIFSSSGTGVIVNDDPSVSTPPYLQVGDATLVEGDSGTTNLVFTVTLTPASGGTVSVTASTSDGSAIAPTDYTAVTQPLTFTAGQTSKTVSVPIAGDTVPEPDEYFYVSLASPSGASILDGTAYGRIINNDAHLQLSTSHPAAAEGNSGTSPENWVVSLSAASPNTVTVNYATSDGSAIAGSDYQSANGTLTFLPGQTSKTVPVSIIGDTVREGDEYYYFSLSTPVNATILSSGLGYIVNDDTAPGITITDSSAYEGNSGTNKMTFTVKLQPASPNTVTMNYATSDGSAIAGSDYVAASGSVNFAPGATTQTLTVNVTGDNVKENNEYFYVSLSSLVGGDAVDTQAFGNIIDDDLLPTLSLSDATVTEGNSGTTNAAFTATLSTASSNTVTVNYATSDGSAQAGSDYAAASSSLTFTPGQMSKTINVAVTGDTAIEGDEYFYVYLASPVNVSVVDSSAYGWIINDDQTPTVSATVNSVTEGDSGSQNQVFNVTLSPASPNTVTVAYATSDGSATSGSDYAATTGTVTFNPGDTSKNVSVSVLGDTTPENNEYYALYLSSPVNARIAGSPTYAFIINNDAGGQAASPYFAVNNPTVTEGNSGTVNETFTVSLTPAPTGTVFVNYYTSDNSATGGVDYVPQVGTLTFAPGQTSKTVSVAVNGDTVDEADEAFYLNLASPAGAGFAINYGSGTILDDDVTPRVSVGDATVIEGDSGTVTAAFTVSLSFASTQPVFVDWFTSNNTAVAPGDYIADNDTLLFNPGQTSQTVNITVNSDTLIEGTETYFLNINNAVGAVLSDQDGAGVILDVDTFPVTGSVLDGSGNGMSGVLVTRTGNNLPTASVTTPADGTFTLANLPDGNYTVTPTKSGVTFFPDHVTVTVKGASLAINSFVGATGNFVQGNIQKAGKALAGVTVTRSGGAQPTATGISNVNGDYVISDNPNGTYTITPTKGGTTFTPPSKSVPISGAPATGINFTGT